MLKSKKSLRAERVIGPVLVGAALVVLAGCQSYERSPLDLSGHAARQGDRVKNIEPIHLFIDRLEDAGHRTPERFDLSDGLTLAEAEVLAMFYNADLRLARLDAGIAKANYDTAGLWEDPVFGFDGAQVLSPSSVFEFGLTFGLTIPISGRLAVEKDRAGAEHDAQLYRIADAEWTTRVRVRSAWSAWSAALERQRLVAEVVVQVERVSSVTDRLEEAGELTRVESRLIRAELVALRLQRITSAQTERASRLALLGLLGLAPDTDLTMQPGFATPTSPEATDTTRRLIEANSELAVRRAEYRVAEETLRLEVRKQYPDLTIGGGFGSEDKDDRLLLGVSLPIPLLNGNRGGIARAYAEREKSRALAETTFERLMHEYALVVAEHDALQRQTQAIETELVPMLDLQLREIERLAELGEVDTPLLLETLKRRYETKNALLDFRLQTIQAEIARVRLLGPEEPAPPGDATEKNKPASTNDIDSDKGVNR